MSGAKRYFCATCHTRASAAGMCAKCPDEPLLDLADPETMSMLEEMDDGVRFRHMGKIMAIAGAAALPLTFGVYALADVAGMSEIMPPFIYALIGAGVGMAALATKLWKPHKSAPELSAHELAQFAQSTQSEQPGPP